MKMPCPKISNPKEFVELEYEDKGCLVPAFDIHGVSYEAYTTLFKFNGEKHYSIVDANLIKTNGVEARFEEDCIFLAKHDLNLVEYAKRMP